MNWSLQTILKRMSATALALGLAVPAALGQAADPQAKARAKLAFDVAKRFFRDGMFTTAVERFDAFAGMHPGSAASPEKRWSPHQVSPVQSSRSRSCPRSMLGVWPVKSALIDIVVWW